MCFVHSDQQLPPIALSNMPNLAVPKYIVACLSHPRFQYLAHCMLVLTNGMFTASFTFLFQALFLLYQLALSYIFFTSNSCCCHVRDIFYPFCPVFLSNKKPIKRRKDKVQSRLMGISFVLHAFHHKPKIWAH